MHWMNVKSIYDKETKKSYCMFNATLIIGDTSLVKINVFNALPITVEDNIADITYDYVELYM